MDVTNFIGDFESIEDLLQHPETKPGDSAYIVNGGHLYIAVGTKAGMDWKRLKVGKGSRGLPVRPVQLVLKVKKVHKESKVLRVNPEGMDEMDLMDEMVSTVRTDVMEHPDGMPSLSVRTDSLVKTVRTVNPARVGTTSLTTQEPDDSSSRLKTSRS